jgi:hypothetical protein
MQSRLDERAAGVDTAGDAFTMRPSACSV